ncbi:PstS family phosphate ABC transporter substrate-binding protein [Myxococcota bacterium]|nr:PstS family phosphate ABC transporter substrate-binding protein [Myxococcota bacterium]MCZ7620548.1 PstS family phosphate ABC transporter substrate-binding protein [Myxococcota bacterium]
MSIDGSGCRAGVRAIVRGVALALAGAATAEFAIAGAPTRAAETIAIDGSSTVYPVMEAVAEEFQAKERGKVRVTVGISGTGGGFKKFCRGETDLSDASRPILDGEMAACKAAGIQYFELPIAYDAITVAVSPQNDWVDAITVEELRKIWEPAAQGKILRWNQIRPEWPDEPLMLFGSGADSGTFDYFTEAIVGKAKSSRGDYTGSEDDNVLVQGIENNKYAMGYIPYAYYAPHTHRMKALAIVAEPGAEGVLPSMENVKAGTYQPLARPLFLYVSAKSAERPAVQRVIEFIMTEGPALIEEVKYLALPPNAYPASLARFRAGATGTVFGGKPEVGVSLEDLLAREAVH